MSLQYAVTTYSVLHTYGLLLFLLSRRKMHLQTFIKTLSETGHGAKLSLFPFTDLQDEVERALNKGARQTPALTQPNYHTILYAYYIYRGDYRNGMQSD